ncbi:MAG: hypothetical protein PF904_14700 [Kiritimatiellae bacterium]|nr:hypothetical protein [Kiritimatiellia bacterium]
MNRGLKFSGWAIRLLSVMLLSLTVAYAVFGADELPQLNARKNQSRFPAPPMYSGDGAVVVLSSVDKASYRGPVLVFVNRTRDMFLQGVNLKMGSLDCPLEVKIGDKNDGDKSVLSMRVRDKQGALREKIELPDPEAADLTRFKRAIIVAFLRVYMVDQGGTDKTMQNLPNWLIDGVIRHLEGVHRQADLDRTHLLWSNACLPPAEVLYRFDSSAAKSEPAVAAVLAGWFMEKRGVGFKALMKGVANGRKWSPEYAAGLLVDTFAGEFDMMFDMRLQALGRRVVKPGVTTAGIMRRFRSELLLFPSDYGMMFSKKQSYYNFGDAVTEAEDVNLQKSALARVVNIKMAAVGRDGMLLALSERYIKFLTAFAEGAEQSDLMKMLMQAESMRCDLENRLGSGAVLKRNLDK